MSYVTRCDAEDCNGFTRTLLEGWIKVHQWPWVIETDNILHFCSWKCLHRFVSNGKSKAVQAVKPEYLTR